MVFVLVVPAPRAPRGQPRWHPAGHGPAAARAAAPAAPSSRPAPRRGGVRGEHEQRWPAARGRAARPHVCCLHHGLHMYRIHDRIGVSARSPRLSPRAAPRRRPWGLRQSIALERSKTPTAVLTNAVTLAGRSLAAELLDSFWTSRRGTSSAHAPRPRWTAYERVARDQA